MTTSITSTETKPVEILILREFKAPRLLVFKAWTDPKSLAQWWGPKGFDIQVSKLELKPGGQFHYSMATPDGNKMWGLFTYHEISAPHRLTFVNCFSDENRNITRNPWLPTWPLEVMNILELTEENGITKLVLRGWPLNATPEELKVFEEGRAGMNQGFAGTFEQLDVFLAKEQK